MHKAIAVWAVASVALLAALAAAQTAGVDSVTVGGAVDCLGASTRLTVDLNVYGQVQPQVVGWIVERQTMGLCAPSVQVGDVHLFEPGQHQYTFDDQPAIGYNALYYVWGVSASGERFWTAWNLPNWRDRFVQSACAGGAIARGPITPFQEWYTVVPCAGQCWTELSGWDTILPDDPQIPALVGWVIEIQGALHMGMEGLYVAPITGWNLSAPCDSGVRVEPTTWSRLKTIYR